MRSSGWCQLSLKKALVDVRHAFSCCAVEEIFRLLSECAALNPDSDDGDSEEGTFFYNVDNALANMSTAVMENAMEDLEIEDGQGDLDELVGDDPERFEDAEEEEDPRPNGWTRH